MKAQTATMSVESPNAEAVYSGALNPSELARYFNSSNSGVVSEAEEARGLKRELGRTAVPQHIHDLQLQRRKLLGFSFTAHLIS